MKCTHPFRAWKELGQEIFLPCGWCIACRINRSNEWAARLIHELDYFDKAAFVTLTYDWEFLPKRGSLKKDDLVQWLNAVRERKRRQKSAFKYFAVGEYGEKFGRPHYHVIALGMGHDEEEIVHDIWKKGLVHVGTVTADSIRYVTDYIKGKFKGELQKDAYLGRQEPFQLSSQGLGARYIKKNEAQLRDMLCVTVKGAVIALPRYYRKKLCITTETNAEYKKRVDESYMNELTTALTKSKSLDSDGTVSVARLEEHRKKARALREKNLKALQRMRQKGRF